MYCRICGIKSGNKRLCEECRYFLKNGADEETLKRMYSDDKTKKIWEENEKIAEDLADAYYDFVIENYKSHLKDSSKENFGYNTFVDGIRVGLDTIIPMLDEEGQSAVKDKICNMIKIRKKKA